MGEIKVFKLNDYEWWAGEDLESIKPAYLAATGIEPDSDEGFDNPKELSDEQLREKIIYFDEGERADSSTFKEYLDELIARGRSFPCYFAGTEY